MSVLFSYSSENGIGGEQSAKFKSTRGFGTDEPGAHCLRPFEYRHMALIRLYDLNMYSVLQRHFDFWTASAAKNYLAALPGAMLFDSVEKTNELALAIQESEKSAAGASILAPCYVYWQRTINEVLSCITFACTAVLCELF